MDTPCGIPVMLDLQGWRCAIIGGGPVALRRARTLLDAGAGEITVIAPAISPDLLDLSITAVQRDYQSGDLARLNPRLVIIATSDRATNDAAVQEAAQLPGRPLINRTDEHSGQSDLTFMAAHRDGPLTLAVHTGGASASAARTLRDQFADQLDPAWPRVLEVALTYRRLIQQRAAEGPTRQALLARLSEPRALAVYHEGGEAALRSHYDAMMEGSA